MINRIVDELAFKLKTHNTWLETSVGIVTPIKSKSREGVDVIEPVYFNNDRNYCNGSDFISLVPDSSKTSMAYFELNGNPTVTDFSSNNTVFDASVTCVVWFRHTALNIGMFDNDILVANFMQSIPRTIQNVESQYFRVYIDVVDIEVNTGDVFKKYTYNDQQQFIMYPYGYFAIKMNIGYGIPKCSTFVSDPSSCHNPKLSPLPVGETSDDPSKVERY